MSGKVGNPYKHRFKYGKQTTPIDFKKFREAMETGDFKKRSHKSFLAFLFWFGVRKIEALERLKEDFTVKERVLVVNAPGKKSGKRDALLQLPLNLPYMDLIIDQVKQAKKRQRVWSFSRPTAWRIVKRALGKKYYPEYLRSGRETRERTGILQMQIKRVDRASRIAKALQVSNLLFEAKRNAKLVREDNIMLIGELYTECDDETHFTTKIARLANLFEVPLAPLRGLVHEPNDRGSIRLVEKWLQDERISHDADMIETWKNILVIRNAEPLHANTKAVEFLRALKFFGIHFPIDYSKPWDAILERFVMSMEAWQRILENL